MAGEQCDGMNRRATRHVPDLLPAGEPGGYERDIGTEAFDGWNETVLRDAAAQLVMLVAERPGHSAATRFGPSGLRPRGFEQRDGRPAGAERLLMAMWMNEAPLPLEVEWLD